MGRRRVAGLYDQPPMTVAGAGMSNRSAAVAGKAKVRPQAKAYENDLTKTMTRACLDFDAIMILSHRLHPKGSIERDGPAIGLCNGQSQPICALFSRPLGCSGKDLATSPLAAQGGAHRDGVDHGGRALQRHKSRSTGPVGGAAQDYGLGPRARSITAKRAADMCPSSQISRAICNGGQ